MKPIVRRALIGLLCGSVSSFFLCFTLGNVGLGLALGALLGIAQTFSFFDLEGGSAIDRAMTCAALGLFFWATINVILLPMAAPQGPQWTAEEMRALFPALIGWVLFCFLLGALTQAARRASEHFLGPESPRRAPSPPAKTTQVIILGGGFAGVTTAEHLEKQFRDDPTVSFTLVSETNSWLFTPMLVEVAASGLEPTHITTPLRTSLKRTRVLRGKVTSIDLEARRVQLSEDGPQSGQHYDHLVLALGSVSNYSGNAAVAENALEFKTLSDAMRIRNHVIDVFERADAESSLERRRALLTFVVAGGGFSGAELAGGLNDFARGMIADYPSLSAADLRIVLAHSRERILPELSKSLADYAMQRMHERGVTFKLNTRVTDAGPGSITLSSGEEIVTETFVWTAGATPSPILQKLPIHHDNRGAVLVDRTLAVPGYRNVWALGDGASVPDTKPGKTCPPTAQAATRQAAFLATNIRASLLGRRLKPFRFQSLGSLCVVGHHTACAEILGLKFSGLFAWLLWRGVYLTKLPGLERKVRVLTDWTLELFFPRDIVQTIDFNGSGSRQNELGVTLR
ncbi:MAG: NAD(P)/FAD-dependent oxidoreductase [Chthoniobacterales bacterium]